jgi:hypothetical protein
MTTMSKSKGKAKEVPVRTHELDGTNLKLKPIGGSNYDDWNNILATQAMASGWYGNLMA